jgi:hypothetical protein
MEVENSCFAFLFRKNYGREEAQKDAKMERDSDW